MPSARSTESRPFKLCISALQLPTANWLSTLCQRTLSIFLASCLTRPVLPQSMAWSKATR
eukprot:1655635-Amphidinium_carterae.1